MWKLFLAFFYCSCFGASNDYQIICRNGNIHIFEKKTPLGPKDFLGPCPKLGDKISFGKGSIQTYLQINPDGSPNAYGFTFSDLVLQDLPSKETPNDFQNCYDADENGVITPQECVGGHSRFLFFPKHNQRAPIRWGAFSYYPKMNLPPEIVDSSLLDFRFNILGFLQTNAIKLGPCPGLLNCEDFAKAKKDLPENYQPRDYTNLEAVEGKVGNRMMDLTAKEFETRNKFSKTFIYGSYNGHLTFLEIISSVGFLKGKKSQCSPIKRPKNYEEPGFYPTKYCIKYWAPSKRYFVSLEGFVKGR
jgi:hypothetical protein